MRKTSIDNGNSQILREIIREREIALSLNKEPCILWVRVSTAKTEQDKSLLDQQALAQEYAEKNGFHVCYCWAVRETASKAKDRKSFQSLVAILNNDNVGITHVICKNRKRLNRNLDDRVVLDQLIRKGVTFHYFITGEKDHMSRTANDRLVRNILTAIDFYEPDHFADEMRAVYKHKAKMGIPPSTNQPFGYLYDSKQKNRVKHPDEQDVVQHLHDEFDTGNYTIAAFVRWANDRGFVGRKGAQWHKGSMDKFLKRPDYCGWFRFHGKEYQGHFESYISRERYLQRLARLGSRRNGLPEHRNHLLRKFVVCPRCGKIWTPELRHGAHRSGNYVYYRHSCKSHAKATYLREESLLRALTGAVDRYALRPDAAAAIQDLFAQDLNEEEKLIQSNQKRARARLGEALRKKQKLLDLLLEEVIDTNDFGIKNAELESLIRGAEADLERTRIPAVQVKQHITESISTLSDFSRIYREAKGKERIEAVRSVADAMIFDLVTGEARLRFREPFSFFYQERESPSEELGNVPYCAQERT
ncbi:MAG: hypothetical protein CMF59_13575 [Leptospiraceae bacterium]|nr:hypothetical protein [Leptospiraceae bacterium]